MIGFILCFTLQRILEALRNRTGTYLESLLLLVNHQEAFFISGQLPMLSYFATGPRDSGGISAQVDHSCHFPRLLPPFQLLSSICGVPILHSHTELYGVQEFAATCYEGGKNIQEEACEILQALSLIIFVENNGFGIQPTGV